jgi:hypothetical protein
MGERLISLILYQINDSSVLGRIQQAKGEASRASLFFFLFAIGVGGAPLDFVDSENSLVLINQEFKAILTHSPAPTPSIFKFNNVA